MSLQRVAIFDLDGTLLDSLQDIALCANTALEISGLPQHTEEEYRGFVGWGADVLMQKMMSPQAYAIHGAKVKADYMMLYNDLCARGCKPYDGVLAMLRELREKGWKTAVVSNKPQEQTQAVQISTYQGVLDLAVGQRQGVPKKPDPTAVLQTLATLGGTPDTAVYVGDSEVDIQTGKNAGIYTIAVTWGFKEKDFLKEFSPDAMADTVEELKKMIINRG